MRHVQFYGTVNFGGRQLLDQAEAQSDEVRKMLFGILDSLKPQGADYERKL